MIDNKIFKGEAWSISLFLVFLVSFYNCMFEILFFLLRILSRMFNTIWVFIFCWDAVICDLICWMLLTNLQFIVVLILLCMCISRVLCAYLTITFCFRNDIWQLRSFDFRKPCFHMYFMNECQNHCISKLHTYWVEKIFLFCHAKGSNL